MNTLQSVVNEINADSNSQYRAKLWEGTRATKIFVNPIRGRGQFCSYDIVDAKTAIRDGANCGYGEWIGEEQVFSTKYSGEETYGADILIENGFKILVGA